MPLIQILCVIANACAASYVALCPCLLFFNTCTPPYMHAVALLPFANKGGLVGTVISKEAGVEVTLS